MNPYLTHLAQRVADAPDFLASALARKPETRVRKQTRLFARPMRTRGVLASTVKMFCGLLFTAIARGCSDSGHGHVELFPR